jgi:hypothetical protein
MQRTDWKEELMTDIKGEKGDVEGAFREVG